MRYPGHPLEHKTLHAHASSNILQHVASGLSISSDPHHSAQPNIGQAKPRPKTTSTQTREPSHAVLTSIRHFKVFFVCCSERPDSEPLNPRARSHSIAVAAFNGGFLTRGRRGFLGGSRRDCFVL